MANPHLFELVTPDDPFGATGAYKKCRIVAHTKKGYHPLFWVAHGPSDDSAVFGFADHVKLNERGTAVVGADGILQQSPDPAGVPTVIGNDGVHATLHPSGLCHVRDGARHSVSEERLDNWLPVLAPVPWLLAISNPVYNSRVSAARRKRDAVFPLDDAMCSIRVNVDLVPRTPDNRYAYNPAALHTLVGLGPQFCLRLTFQRVPARGAAIFMRVDGEKRAQAGASGVPGPTGAL